MVSWAPPPEWVQKAAHLSCMDEKLMFEAWRVVSVPYFDRYSASHRLRQHMNGVLHKYWEAVFELRKKMEEIEGLLSKFPSEAKVELDRQLKDGF